MICTQCGSDIPGGAAACPGCGSRLAAAQGAVGQGTAGPFQPAPLAQRATPGRPAAGHAASPAFRLDLSRLTNSDRITGTGTLLLLVSLFLPWYGVNILGISAEADGLNVHGYLYIVLLLCVACMAYLVFWAGFEELPVRLPLTHEQRLLAVSGVNAALVLLAFLIRPDGTGWRFGAFLGLLAALVAVAPLVGPAVRSRRGRA
jgi:hypothetical protein